MQNFVLIGIHLELAQNVHVLPPALMHDDHYNETSLLKILGIVGFGNNGIPSIQGCDSPQGLKSDESLLAVRTTRSHKLAREIPKPLHSGAFTRFSTRKLGTTVLRFCLSEIAMDGTRSVA